MHITHLCQLVALIAVVVLNLVYRGKKRSVLIYRLALVVVLLLVTFTWYFQRYLLIGELYFHTGCYGASFQVYQDGLKYLVGKPEIYDYLVGETLLREKMHMARERLQGTQGEDDSDLDSNQVLGTPKSMSGGRAVVGQEWQPEEPSGDGERTGTATPIGNGVSGE